MSELRAWVRYLDGRLVLSWHEGGPWGWRSGSRPLTFRERLAWRLSRKVPAP